MVLSVFAFTLMLYIFFNILLESQEEYVCAQAGFLCACILLSYKYKCTLGLMCDVFQGGRAQIVLICCHILNNLKRCNNVHIAVFLVWRDVVVYAMDGPSE